MSHHAINTQFNTQKQLYSKIRGAAKTRENLDAMLNTLKVQLKWLLIAQSPRLFYIITIGLIGFNTMILLKILYSSQIVLVYK